jgi:hypothetical protein
VLARQSDELVFGLVVNYLVAHDARSRAKEFVFGAHAAVLFAGELQVLPESVRRQTDEIRQQWPNQFVRRTERKELPVPKLSTQERNALPPRQFAFPAQRKEPLENASHVRNAIARFDQVQGVSDGERDAAWRRIEAAATLYGVELHEAGWRELFAGPGRAQR